MKIDKVILSSDCNELYLDFWEPVSMVWKEKFGIDPVLYYFYKDYFEEEKQISEKYGEVRRIKLIPSIPAALQAQWARYFFPSLDPNSTWLLSDIDMFGISEFYFVTQLKDIPDNKYVHLNPCMNTYGRIPACYHVAKGINYKTFLELPDFWEQSIFEVFNFSKDRNLNIWFGDENFSTSKLLNKDITFLSRDGGQNGHRIDRDSWGYKPDLFKKDYYYDSHSIRPYKKYKQEIDNLVKLIMS